MEPQFSSPEDQAAFALVLMYNNSRQKNTNDATENKQTAIEQKALLEYQNNNFQNMLSMCMRNFNDFKSESSCHKAVTPGPQCHCSKSIEEVFVADDSFNGSIEEKCQSDCNKCNEPRRSTTKCSAQRKRHERTDSGHSSFSDGSHRRRSIISSTPLPPNHFRDEIKLKFDQATQTDPEPTIQSLERQRIFENTVVDALKDLYAQCLNAFSRVEGIEGIVAQMPPIFRNMPESQQILQNASRNVPVINLNEVVDILNVNNDVQEVNEIEAIQNVTLNDINEEDNSKEKTPKVRRVSAQTTNNVECDVVPIGNGNARVPQRVINEMDWTSYTSATRQLLQAVFSRRILATHSLTGKQSPAFVNKPAKKCLDPNLVDDIVVTVSQRCGVPKRLVRNCITIKCTDEAKLYRNRQKFRRQIRNDGPPSSDESSSIG